MYVALIKHPYIGHLIHEIILYSSGYNMFETITKQQSILAVQYRTTTPYSHQSENKIKENGGKH